MIVGRIRNPKVRDPARMLDPNLNMMTKKARPNKPKTTEGTPARQLMPTLINRIILPCLAYSVRYMAEATPRGRPIAIAPSVR